MSQSNQVRAFADQAAYYKICLYGRITAECHDRLAGMRVLVVEGDGFAPKTVLIGRLADQAALAGVLSCIYDYGLPLISVQRREENNDF